ncbi:MAG: gamma-glutamyltransferase [Porticoccaceae bacterium]
MKRSFLKRLFLLLILPASLALAVEPAIIDQNARFHPAVSSSGMVVSQDAIASEVGADILGQGGNAVDAAVATGFALAVTLPQAGNIGGGGFMLLYLAEEKRTLAIDYREMAPAAASPTMFLDKHGNVVPDQSRFSHRATGVPGTVAGLLYTLQAYGSMTPQQVLAPAIALAEEGFVVGDTLAYSLNQASGRLRADSASSSYFFRGDGTPLQAGDRWQQTDLARTLKRISEQGMNGFYRGETAALIVAEMQRGGGLISQDDLANYRVMERQAVTGQYRGYTIAAMPPPSSGGIHLIEMLNVLEGWDLFSLGHNSAAYLHRLTETMRRAYADRSKYLGDPDFYQVPVARLVDKAYAAELREGIDLNKASRSEDISPGLKLQEESPQTTHFSVWDRWGNVVSNTYTLNFSYGSGISVAGAGFLLNNEMDDFSAKAGVPNAYGLLGGDANAIEAGKRPLSSMTPTIVFKGDEPVLATGSPGGSTIITVVLQNILNLIDFKMNIAEATALPRIHHQWFPDQLEFEAGISPDTLNLLGTMGHKLAPRPRILGKVQAIAAENGHQFGVTDSRWPGVQQSRRHRKNELQSSRSPLK